MNRLRLYVDEDAMDGDLVRGLRSRGIDVITAADAGMIRRKDGEHLSFASMQGRALYSFNVGDFHQIHTECISTVRGHAVSFWFSRSAGENAQRRFWWESASSVLILGARYQIAFGAKDTPTPSASHRK